MNKKSIWVVSFMSVVYFLFIAIAMKSFLIAFLFVLPVAFAGFMEKKFSSLFAKQNTEKVFQIFTLRDLRLVLYLISLLPPLLFFGLLKNVNRPETYIGLFALGNSWAAFWLGYFAAQKERVQQPTSA